jgi:acid phosphatase type 7
MAAHHHSGRRSGSDQADVPTMVGVTVLSPRSVVAAALAIGALACTACGSSPTGSAPASAGAAPVPDAPARHAVVWAVGDGADGGEDGRRVVARIAAGRVDRLLYLGDVYEHGTRTDFAENYAPGYGRLAARTAPTPGNHDWPNHATGYDPYWRRALHRRVPSWYAFRAGGWELLSLNSETDHDPNSAQVRWLRARVRAPGTCRIAFWHRPRYSASTHHGDQKDIQPLWDALRGHATIVLGGHDHDMQRLRPVDGLTQFVSGAGGKHRYPLHRDARLAFGTADVFGALRLDLRPGVARYAFVDAGGRVLDRGAVRCRPTRG